MLQIAALRGWRHRELQGVTGGAGRMKPVEKEGEETAGEARGGGPQVQSAH